ncbi:hypothetical protein QE197_03350 [Arsenophonus nasoniae]|uniref:Uncharacterized protein n=2 Tax=Arsenophonus nasoniae TaxID=638 RepID=A0A4P7KQS6_9GAMM|nr:hypothetical protein [Arsenophonus nasoniae]QBY42335.1 hypothetical protein ArsFIN_08800 [Arsenophonus nasoniae]WGL94786.1 hypothetical protein QE207_13955 [Arsenophonus nasoniae]WGM02288.1 hypothetical protein QE210_04070 [Arsenophonus nasoniae]WGM06473.1 hypothetical protein QE258_03800 [Arsenophonus nasoniae]WGM11407.1 hypothetical protein QE197_03350 [Arsenophonus nasoniae]
MRFYRNVKKRHALICQKINQNDILIQKLDNKIMIIEDEINEINKEILFINSLLADINNVGFLSKDELLAIKRKQAVFNHKLIDLKLEKAKKEAAHQAIIIEKKEKLNIKKILHMKSEKYIFLLKKEMIKIIQRKYLIEENEIEEVLYAKSKLNKNS